MAYILKSGEKWLYNDGLDNGVVIKSDGSLRQIQTARLYEDLVGDMFGKKLYNTAYTVDYNWDENAIKFQANGDITDKNKRIQWNVQLPHNTLIGADSYFRYHLHWWQDSTTPYTMTLRYRIQNNGQPKETAWTTQTVTIGSGSDLETYTGGTLNQLTIFPEIDISSANISSTIQMQMTRTDSETGDMYVTFVDAHYAIDSNGSMTEWSKGA